jgi:hypothetical protein
MSFCDVSIKDTQLELWGQPSTQMVSTHTFTRHRETYWEGNHSRFLNSEPDWMKKYVACTYHGTRDYHDQRYPFRHQVRAFKSIHSFGAIIFRLLKRWDMKGLITSVHIDATSTQCYNIKREVLDKLLDCSTR